MNLFGPGNPAAAIVRWKNRKWGRYDNLLKIYLNVYHGNSPISSLWFAGQINFMKFFPVFFVLSYFRIIGSSRLLWNIGIGIEREKKYHNREIENIKLPRLKIMEQINCFPLTVKKQPFNVQRCQIRREKKKTKCKNAKWKQPSSEKDICRNLSLLFPNTDAGQQ